MCVCLHVGLSEGGGGGQQAGGEVVVAIAPVAQWIRHRPTEPGIAGSSPAGFIWSVENRMQKYRFFAMSVLVGDCGVACGGEVLMIVSERVVSVKCWWR